MTLRLSIVAGVISLLANVGCGSAQMLTDPSIPSALLPLNGTELMYLEQKGASRKITTGSLFANITGNCLSILNYGGDRTGATDNTSAYSATVTAAGAKPCVYFPAGVYAFGSIPPVTLPTVSQGVVTIKGDGVDSTEVRLTGSGFAFGLNGTYQSFHIQNLSITAATACSSCTAISASQNAANPAAGYSGQSDITNVAIYGVDRSSAFPSGSDYFQTGIELNGVSNVNFVNVRIDGVQNSSGPTPGTSRGVYIHGNASEIPVVFNFVNTTINLYNRALDMGSYVQGVTWVNGNQTGNMVGMYVSATPGTGNGQLAIANSQFNNCADIFVPQPGGSIVTLSDLQVSNSYLIAVGQPWSCGSFNTAVSLGHGTTFPILVGNTFGGSAGFTAIQTSTFSYTGGKIAHNMINGFGTAVDTTDPFTTPSGLLIDGNTITNSTTGIKIGATTVDAVVSNNTMQGNTTDLVDNAPLASNFIDIPQDCTALPGLGITFGGAAVGETLSLTYCRYKVISHRAFEDFDYTLNAVGSSTGVAAVQLPVAPVSHNPIVGGYITFNAGMTSVTGNVCGTMGGGVLLLFQNTGGGGCGTALTNANFNSGSRIAGTVIVELPTVQ